MMNKLQERPLLQTPVPSAKSPNLTGIVQQISLSLAVAVISVLLNSWTTAVGLDNRPHGLNAPTAKLTVTSDRLRADDNTYYFTAVMPQQSGRGFTKLSFTQQDQAQGVVPIQFDLASTQVFIGTPDASGRAIHKETWIDETGTVWVEFNQSAAPGTTLTVAFKARKLPPAGSYQYGVAAYPQAENPVAVFVGNGTLTIPR